MFNPIGPFENSDKHNTCPDEPCYVKSGENIGEWRYNDWWRIKKLMDGNEKKYHRTNNQKKQLINSKKQEFDSFSAQLNEELLANVISIGSEDLITISSLNIDSAR